MFTLTQLYRQADVRNITHELPEFMRITDVTVYDALFGGFEIGTILTRPGFGFNAGPIYRDANDRDCSTLFEAVMWCLSEYDETGGEEDE